MILPAKYLSSEQSLIWISGEVLRLIDEPKTVSRLWNELKRYREVQLGSARITYNWFILSLDLLFALYAIEFEQGRLKKRQQ